MKLARRPNLVLSNKKKRTHHQLNFVVLADHSMKIRESEKNEQILRPCKRVKKIVQHEGNWYSWNSLQSLVKGLEELEIRGKNETIQTSAFLSLARRLRRVLET